MCFGRCAKCIGYHLLILAIFCIVANILLYFPNGETKYAHDNHLSRFVWFFHGIGGAGIVMLGSAVAAIIGVAGAGYCLIISALALLEGPLCLKGGQWVYPFAYSGVSYYDATTWSQCTEPRNVVVWNASLFCILLGLAAIQIILCLIQFINGLLGGICAPFCCKQKIQSYDC